VETLLLIPIKEDPEWVRLHQTAIDAAVAAGVRRIVYSSFLTAAPDVTFTFAAVAAAQTMAGAAGTRATATARTAA
jgi:NAD(P)H dehydrogenase (quinone)